MMLSEHYKNLHNAIFSDTSGVTPASKRICVDKIVPLFNEATSFMVFASWKDLTNKITVSWSCERSLRHFKKVIPELAKVIDLKPHEIPKKTDLDSYAVRQMDEELCRVMLEFFNIASKHDHFHSHCEAVLKFVCVYSVRNRAFGGPLLWWNDLDISKVARLHIDCGRQSLAKIPTDITRPFLAHLILTLDCSHNTLTDVAPLNVLSNLTTLYLHNNRLGDRAVQQIRLFQVTTLSLHNNNITNLKLLAAHLHSFFPLLSSLTVAGNPATQSRTDGLEYRAVLVEALLPGLRYLDNIDVSVPSDSASPTTPRQPFDIRTVKLCHNDAIHIVKLPPFVSFLELQNTLRIAVDEPAAVIEYLDGENDRVLVTSDEELEAVWKLARKTGKTPRFFLKKIFRPRPSSAPSEGGRHENLRMSDCSATPPGSARTSFATVSIDDSTSGAFLSALPPAAEDYLKFVENLMRLKDEKATLRKAGGAGPTKIQEALQQAPSSASESSTILGSGLPKSSVYAVIPNHGSFGYEKRPSSAVLLEGEKEDEDGESEGGFDGVDAVSESSSDTEDKNESSEQAPTEKKEEDISLDVLPPSVASAASDYLKFVASLQSKNGK